MTELGRFLDSGGMHVMHIAAAAVVGGAGSEADELVQATLYDALRGWRTFDRSRAIGPWIKTIMHNHRIDDSRRAGRRLDVPIPEDPETSDEAWATCECRPLGGRGDQATVILRDRDEPGHTAEAREIVAAVRAAVAGLKASWRDVVLAVYFDGGTNDDAAAMLGIPPGTVRSRLSRARASLVTRLLKVAA